MKRGLREGTTRCNMRPKTKSKGVAGYWREFNMDWVVDETNELLMISSVLMILR